jgi:DNA topoisomerase VI subunit B
MADVVSADDIFKQFRQYSISEFFRKNAQMLGYSGKVRSLTTIVHEYTSNSLDATEEANILPEIKVVVKQLGEDKYLVSVSDNGPGIPQSHIGKALASVLAGTKFHRYLQQRGQQGIGAAGCTLYSWITTGKPIHVNSSTTKGAYECDVALEIKSNKPLVTNIKKVDSGATGTTVTGEFGDVKYEESDHGIFEYIKRTALANPHASITLVDPEGKEHVFLRSVQEMPKRPKEIKPHPLGIGTNDLIEFAHKSTNNKLSAFLTESFSRVTPSKMDELKQIVPDVNLGMDPKSLTWADAEKLVKGFKQVKWIAPELDSLSTIGEQQISLATKNILNPKFMSVVERRPRVFRGGIPFVVEAVIAYGGNAGRVTNEGSKGATLRFSNKVPLLFDASSCAITAAVNGIEWKRYGVQNFEEEPVSVLVNVSSVYVPYSGVGKQAIAQEDEIIEEIKLAVMECGRALQRHISGIKNANLQESRYNTVIRYVKQMSSDLAEITDSDAAKIEIQLRELIENRYKKAFEGREEEVQETAAEAPSDPEGSG